MKKLNLIRRQVIKLRQRNGWTQEEFAVQLQLAGWHNATRSTVSKIEGGSFGDRVAKATGYSTRDVASNLERFTQSAFQETGRADGQKTQNSPDPQNPVETLSPLSPI